MKIKLHVFLLSLISLALILTSCSTTTNIPTPYRMIVPGQNIEVKEVSPTSQIAYLSGAPVTNRGSIGGSIQAYMDKTDRSKMSRGLDSGLGKSAHWVNNQTKISYTVTPTAKLTFKGNPLCRRYNLTAEDRGRIKQFAGTACLESDGEWHPAS